METKLFSDSLDLFDKFEGNPVLQDSLISLGQLLGTKFKVLKWDERSIAIPIDINVDLPTLGTKNGLDIRSIEPVVIVFDVEDYPSKAPSVFTDRLDFPKDNLAHLYVALPGRPPGICYVRGSRDEWYANKRIQDLVSRTSNWFRDAAAGELTEDGDQFEPLRLEGYSGTNTYDYDLFANVVNNNKSFIPDQNWALGLFDGIKGGDIFSYKFNKFLDQSNYEKIIDEVEVEIKKGKDDTSTKKYHYGYVLWSKDTTAFRDYQVTLPDNWNEFKTFCDKFQIDYRPFENVTATIDLNHFINFPVIVAIKRPANLIGFSSNIEFVNFKFFVDTDDVEGEIIKNNVLIKFQAHSQPLTTLKAREISGLSGIFSGRQIVFGCGALGSKLVMHFARSGNTKLTLVDPDHVSPHNLVRHALHADSIGVNKAFALSETIKKMFPSEPGLVVYGPSLKDGLFFKPETFAPYSHLFDFTASEAFFNKLVTAPNINVPQVFSASISDFGNLGILYKEGPKRNPRIDDLQAFLFCQGETNSKVKDWLNRERAANNDENLIVHVGVGCNSETTVLSDSKISVHSSYFAGAITNGLNKSISCGRLYLSRIIDDASFSIETSCLDVEPFSVLDAVNDPSWSVRFRSGILNQITTEAVSAKKKEAGGVFVGTANHKTKVIHVTGLISAPPDSVANNVCFYRGYKGLPEQIATILDRSGGQIGYIGEWHSHPDGPNGLSSVDMATVAKFKDELSSLNTPLPVFLTLVTPAGILPHVF